MQLSLLPSSEATRSSFPVRLTFPLNIHLPDIYHLLGASSRTILNPDKFQEFPLIQKTATSHNVAIYRFGLPRPTDTLGLPIGQHISLAATPKGAEMEVVRSYTPISSDENKGYFDLM